MNHLTSIQLCAFLDDALVGAPDDQMARHLASCAMCRARYEAWCHVDDSLRELFGQVPDEYAMEQRTTWVEIAVTAERKGLPAPEFAELRIPLAPPATPAGPPLQLYPATAAPAPYVPPPAGFAADPGPSPSRAPIKRPVLQVSLPAAVAPAAPAYAPPPGAPAPRLPARQTVAAGAGAAGRTGTGERHGVEQEPASAAHAKGYARMPSPPRKGFAAFAGRPVVWLSLVLVAVIAAAFPLGIARFGVPEIRLGSGAPRERDSAVRKAVAERASDRKSPGAAASDGAPARRSATPAKPAPAARGGAATDDADDSPDASILFDLPALEPEDGEPDPPATEQAPKRPEQPGPGALGAAGSDDGGDEPGDAPMICGEVRNTQGVPIEGARVYLASPARMVRTDRRGRFCVTCPPGTRTVRIEAAGRAPVTRTMQLGSERLETRFTLDAAN